MIANNTMGLWLMIASMFSILAASGSFYALSWSNAHRY